MIIIEHKRSRFVAHDVVACTAYRPSRRTRQLRLVKPISLVKPRNVGLLTRFNRFWYFCE